MTGKEKVPIESIGATPNDEEYERLKKTMGIMVQFYVNGTLRKADQRDAAQAELDKVELHLRMVDRQLEALKPFGEISRQPPSIEKVSTCPVPSASAAATAAGGVCPVEATGAPDEETPVEDMSSWEDIEFKSKYDIDGVPIDHLNTHKTPTVVTTTSHPKLLELGEALHAERDSLLQEQTKFQKLVDEYEMLHKWSQRIVESVQWLESNLERYCNEVMKPCPNFKEPAPKTLTPEDIKDFRKGLAEVTYNLQESQDFFQASLDGRLEKYHKIEHEILKAQLEAIREFPESDERRMALEPDLLKDIEYVAEHLTPDEKVMARRHKMTEMHKDFWDVLRWNREKLQAM